LNGIILTSKNKSIEAIQKEIEDLQPLKVSFHRDADGVYSLALLNTVFKIEEVYSPKVFGNYFSDDFKANVGLDLGEPIENEFKGVVIDHHTHSNPWYSLIWSIMPTGLIVYNVFKERIPDNEKWKVVGAVCGDGQPELIPDELWDMFPELREERGNMYMSYNKITSRTYPIYSLITSPINSLCRIGEPIEAFKAVRNASSPYDLLDSEYLKDAVSLVQKEEQRIFNNKPSLTVKNNIAYTVIESKYYIASRIASLLSRSFPNLTLIVINRTNKEISIRGVYTSYICNKLVESGFKAGCHPGFGGCTLGEDQTIEDFIYTLKTIF